MTNRAIMFDLDGTLIDQFDAIHRAFSRVLVEMGFPAPSYEKVKCSVGGASETTMCKLIGEKRAEEAVDRLRPIFEEEMFTGLRALPGSMEILGSCYERGIQAAVLTNKYGPHARAACKHLGFCHYLEFTMGANDTEWRKPDPALTNHALSKLKLSPKEAIYVGDSPYDFHTAKNAKMDCILVATGTHPLEELKLDKDVPVLENLFEVNHFLFDH